MTRRQAMLDVFGGHGVERAPVCLRLNLWHTDAVSRGAVPAGIRGQTHQQVEDYLGFCRSARHRARTCLAFRCAEAHTRQQGQSLIEEHCFPGRCLVRRTHNPGGGMVPYIVEYPLKAEEDYDLLLSEMDAAYLDFDIEGFDRLDAETGDAGLPVLVLHSCPAHLLMLQWAGYESFFLHLADFPIKVERLISRVEGIYRRDLWPAASASHARLVLHGNHFSSTMTPPPIFEKHFSAYFEAFNELMHSHGKQVMWHADAEMNSLLHHVLEAGFDGADCLATAPLVPQTMEGYFEAWGGRIVCWGGLPSLISDSAFPLEEYKAYVNRLVELTRGRNDFIFGASDNVMPGAEWDRLVYLAEVTGCLEHQTTG